MLSEQCMWEKDMGSVAAFVQDFSNAQSTHSIYRYTYVIKYKYRTEDYVECTLMLASGEGENWDEREKTLRT